MQVDDEVRDAIHAERKAVAEAVLAACKARSWSKVDREHMDQIDLTPFVEGSD